ncbi:MAG: hypothetical protein U5L76_05460 [Patescibacteria group bacterium]|nr:hypothetical protein [Patescibacteria group bacterium]
MKFIKNQKGVKKLTLIIALSAIIGIIIIAAGFFIWQKDSSRNQIKNNSSNLKNNQEINNKNSRIEFCKKNNCIDVTKKEENNQITYLFNISFNNYNVAEVENLKRYNGYLQVLTPSSFNYNANSVITNVEITKSCPDCKPMLPVLIMAMKLPNEAKISSELIDYQENLTTDNYNIIPCINCTSYGCGECNDYPTTDEYYPKNISIKDNENNIDKKNTLYQVFLPLMRYNPSIKQSYIVNKAQIKVTSKQNSNLIINNFSTSKDTYNIGEPIVVDVGLKNLGLNSINNIYLDVKYIDELDNKIDIYKSKKFNIEGGNKKELSLNLDNSLEIGRFIIKADVKDTNSQIITSSDQWFGVYFSDYKQHHCTTKSDCVLSSRDPEGFATCVNKDWNEEWNNNPQSQDYVWECLTTGKEACDCIDNQCQRIDSEGSCN